MQPSQCSVVEYDGVRALDSVRAQGIPVIFDGQRWVPNCGWEPIFMARFGDDHDPAGAIQKTAIVPGNVCPECKGKKVIQLFTSTVPCRCVAS